LIGLSAFILADEDDNGERRYLGDKMSEDAEKQKEAQASRDAIAKGGQLGLLISGALTLGFLAFMAQTWGKDEVLTRFLFVAMKGFGAAAFSFMGAMLGVYLSPTTQPTIFGRINRAYSYVFTLVGIALFLVSGLYVTANLRVITMNEAPSFPEKYLVRDDVIEKFVEEE